ncbi:MAG: hypothetical protein JSR33_04915 [Proteobacteria bacterium]|nr:hypothetical protein [Pseudomonadota bacterium]
MSTIKCGFELSTLFKNDTKTANLNDLALWILQVGYGQYKPSFIEILHVKNELRKIYTYEGIKFETI